MTPPSPPAAVSNERSACAKSGRRVVARRRGARHLRRRLRGRARGRVGSSRPGGVYLRQENFHGLSDFCPPAYDGRLQFLCTMSYLGEPSIGGPREGRALGSYLPLFPHKITSNAREQCFLPIAEASMRSGTATYKYHQQPKNSVNYRRLCTSIAMSRKLPMLMTFHFLHFMVIFPFLFLIWKPDVALIQPGPRDVPIITSLWSLLEYVQAFTKLA